MHHDQLQQRGVGREPEYPTSGRVTVGHQSFYMHMFKRETDVSLRVTVFEGRGFDL